MKIVLISNDKLKVTKEGPCHVKISAVGGGSYVVKHIRELENESYYQKIRSLFDS